MSAVRIIDRDVGFYQAALEEEQRRLRHCAPWQEPQHARRICLVSAILSGLSLLRAELDAEVPTREADLCDRD